MSISQKERVIAQINHIETDPYPITSRLTQVPISKKDSMSTMVTMPGAAKLTMPFSNCRSPAWR